MKHYLIIATGGGYDILTAHMLAWKLKLKADAKIDLVGMLNPKFKHFYFDVDSNNNVEVLKESSIVFLSMKSAVRFKTASVYLEKYPEHTFAYCRDHFEERDFMDIRLAANSEFRLFNFSLRYSQEEQVQFMMKYDKVFLCDVGGDILYAGRENREIKTPIVDAYALMLARLYIERGGNCDLFIIAPGSDRELTREHLLENLENVDSECIEISSYLVDKLSALFLCVRKGNSGNTVKRILNAFGLYDNLNEQKCECLEKEMHQCNIDKAIMLNPLSRQNSATDIVRLYNKINSDG